MRDCFVILGSGRQGTATAYDLMRFAKPKRIILGDFCIEQAEKSAEKLRNLAEKEGLDYSCLQAMQLDAANKPQIHNRLQELKADSIISGVPYFFNLELSQIAIDIGADFFDYGGNTDIVKAQLALNEKACREGVCLIPDCGMAPGLANSLSAYAISLLDSCDTLLSYDCGLPQNPSPPWNYSLFFSIEGLTNEYAGKSNCLQDGKLHHTECFEEYEVLDFEEPAGRLEAFTTFGGAGTLPFTYEGKIRSLKNKTLRYPGHFAEWKVFKKAGLFELAAVEVDGTPVVPRHLLHAVMEPQIKAKPGEKDLVIIRILARGQKDGKPSEVQLDLVDYYDEEKGFSAMERSTGFHAGIMSGLAASGRIGNGAFTVESAIAPELFLKEFKKRGFSLKEKIRTHTAVRESPSLAALN